MASIMSTAISGMRAHAAALDVHGNNIANLNTTAFKASRPSFATLFSQTLREGQGATATSSGSNPVEIGAGVNLSNNTTIFEQGTTTYTGEDLDMAIQGNGFFVVENGTGETSYTRDGSFSMQANGTLVHTASGLKVQGLAYDATAGTFAATPADVVIPPGLTMSATPTSNAGLAGNLDSSAATGDTANLQYAYYDSLGAEHVMDVTFTKTATANQWTWAATVGGTSVGTGTVTFSATGDVATGGTGTTSLTTANGGVSTGATSPQALALDLSRLTQLESDSELQVTDQDGFQPGFLTGVSADDAGQIVASFSNGQSRPVAQLVLASFANQQGLQREAGNLFNASASTGVPQIVLPGGSGVGSIQSQSLEKSNVDLPTELTALLMFQRGYQASARLVSTADEIMQEALNLKR